MSRSEVAYALRDARRKGDFHSECQYALMLLNMTKK